MYTTPFQPIFPIKEKNSHKTHHIYANARRTDFECIVNAVFRPFIHVHFLSDSNDVYVYGRMVACIQNVLNVNNSVFLNVVVIFKANDMVKRIVFIVFRL